ncbi:MAG: hypothetical protein Q7U16_09880 [Agitococcus sp.]|nr:hypothetical protein [Agitococcus sp.]
MKINGITSTEKRSREEQRARYAPRKSIKIVVLPDSKEHTALKKLTAEVREQLKLPSAIPSRVIHAALVKARAF